MNLIRIAICGLLLGGVGAGASLADSYQCTFKPRRVEKGLMPTTLRIDWPDFLRPAHITDTITEANGFKHVFAEVPVETSKRVTFAWRLQQIYIPNLSQLTGYSNQKGVDVMYRATIYPSSKKIILTAEPIIRFTPSANSIRAEGRCKVIK